MDMPRRLGAEFFGTFWLTFAGCGSAVLAAGFPSLGIGFLGVSFAFGFACAHPWRGDCRPDQPLAA
jgi:aquaporin Z